MLMKKDPLVNPQRTGLMLPIPNADKLKTRNRTTGFLAPVFKETKARNDNTVKE